MDNPNEYDDEAYLAASNALQDLLTEALNELWDAGASKQNIEMELATAIENMEGSPFISPRVEISGP